MIAAQFSTVRSNFREYCDKAVNDYEPIIVARERGENVVIISEAEYNNMLENMFIRQDPVLYARIIQANEELKKGLGKKRELVDE